MPRSKHHEYTGNNQDVTYAEMKMTKFPQKQRIPKAKQSPVILSEDQLNYAALTFHRSPQLLPPKRVVRGKRQGQGPRATVWRMVTGILGVLCVVLMTAMGILLPKYGICDLCSQNWTAFGNSFYHVFREIKTWAESQSSCKELRSHVVKIDSKAELENLLVFGIHGWILLKTNETVGFSSWVNDIKTEQNPINDPEKKNYSCLYVSKNQFYPEDCSSKKPYICEFNIS